ncbi:Spc24 subunit of Ndc80-domain-containing protein [Lipomyces japonicus]|uniref:Spc24 subunit of Ndc80-domain-containing protein n=1 Tax=Lipomyces japonicus TaxID=56871 RepID=UPI0034CD0FB4
MALIQNVPVLLSSTLSNFQIAPDVQALSRINDHIRILKSARDIERDQLHDILRSLSRRLELAKQAASAAPASPSGKSHTERILQLDREKFSLAKTINDLESAYHSAESMLARLTDELERVKTEDVMADTSAQQDSTILLLKVYRSLGISLEDNGMGGYAKAIVRSQQNNDIHVLSLDKSYSNFFIANYLWDMM